MSIESRIVDSDIVDFTIVNDGESTISILEKISVKRLFMVEVNQSEERGEHAHKGCAQWISVLRGQIRVTLKDSYSSTSHKLTNDGKFLYVPPGIWASQSYSTKAIALVLCDQTFNEADYIRDWEEYLNYKKGRIN